MTDYANALPASFRLHEYEVVRVLGYGGFGITYLGYDHHLDKAVAIKEFLPPEMATRRGDHSVVAHSTGHQSDFRWGLERFLEEARTLARFDDRHIVKVHRFFEAHGTGYIVMEYAEGEPLSERLRRCGRLSEAEFKSLLLPMLSGLERVHEAKFLHRDIKPGNIMIRADGSPVLIDFGAARQAVGAKSRSVTSIVTPGYAPIEQYSTRGRQGPWTDIYALGAVGYRALTGRDPEDATERMRDDPLEPLVSVCRGEASETFLTAIDWALRVDEGDRPQDVAAFRAALLGGALPAGAGAVQSGRSGAPQPTPSAAAAGSGTVRPKTVVWVLVGAGAIGLVVLLGWLARDEEPPAVAQTQEPSERSEPVSPVVPAVAERREVVTPAPQVEAPAPSQPVTPPAPVAASPTTHALTVAELLARLEERPDTERVPWSATADPTADGAGGAVVWNPAEQVGLMRISGLQPNDPAVYQYQLWIFDAERDDRFPVDGGVFDVSAGVDETLVPINLRLRVGRAALFAVTVESPGGAVVSSRERIALVAQPGT